MAKYKRKKIKNLDIRQVLTGMIVSEQVLRDIMPMYKRNYIQVPFAKRVADWCIQFYKKYEKAPKGHIQDIFNSNVRKGKIDEEEAELISDFLSTLSEEYENEDNFNARYVLDKAEEMFKTNNLKMLSEDLETALSEGDVTEAERLLAGHKRIERPVADGVDPFTDKESIFDAFENTNEPLFKIPGKLGQLLNDFLVRDALISFMGKEKIGKTWNLIELAVLARMNRLNVAFFEVGDMSQGQLVRRFHIRSMGRSDKKRYCGDILVPVLDCVHNQEDKCNKAQRTCSVGLGAECSFEDAPSNYKPCTYCYNKRRSRFQGAIWYKERTEVEPITWREAFQKGRRTNKFLKGKKFKLVCRPNGTVSVDDISATLEIWEEYEAFVPDVIIIDYADILRHEGSKDDRNKINETWKALRRLSQHWHCLVITATQADASSYDSKILKTKNFTDDKRKYSHVTATIGLNQTEDEKRIGLMRMNVLLAREEDFDSTHAVNVLQCLQVGKPWIASYW